MKWKKWTKRATAVGAGMVCYSVFPTYILKYCWILKDRRQAEEAEKILYLTFDDGPTQRATPKILDILKEEDVTVHNIHGSHIISINVPEALPKQKPIYIGDNIISGTYRRDGDGDYRCNFREILDMLNSE